MGGAVLMVGREGMCERESVYEILGTKHTSQTNHLWRPYLEIRDLSTTCWIEK